MSSRIRTYTRIGLLYPLFFSIIIFPQLNFANSIPKACPIWTGSEPIQEYTTKSSGEEKNTYCPDPQGYWWPVAMADLSDDQYTSLSLSGLQRSNCLDIQGFDFHIPEFSIIAGIQIIVEGHVEGSGIVKEEKIQLLGKDGEEIGENRAGAVLLGSSWTHSDEGTDFTWVYSYDSDTWGADLTPEIVKDEDFGVRFQLRNYSFSSSSVFIDQIQIKIHYTPPVMLCGHDCVAFFVDTLSQDHRYNWYLPEGFVFLNGDEHDYIINMGIAYAEFGLYQICVETVSDDGISDPCCRNFIYDDCRESSIGDFVWEDLNANGIQNPGEPGIEGVMLQLFDENNVLVDTSFTDSNGKYLFDSLQKGDYYIRLSNPIEFVATQSNVGMDDSLDSDILNLSGILRTDLFYLNPGIEEKNLDFGLYKFTSVSGLVWEDLDGDGIQSDEEPPVSQIKVNLLDEFQMQIETQLTGIGGFYEFNSLIPGEYYIEFEIIDPYQITLKDQGVDDINDSDAGSEGITDVLVLNSGALNQHVDIGIFKFASLGDYVWLDLNRNGIQDMDEEGISDMAVSLKNEDGELISETFSQAGGFYLFEDLIPGSYFLEFSPDPDLLPSMAEAGSDPSIDSDMSETNGPFTTNHIDLESGEEDLTIDAGFVFRPASICGKVWEDITGNGIFDGTDPKLDEININLYEMNGLLLSGTMSNQDGTYCFENLNPGNYYLLFEHPSGFIFTTADAGMDDEDSDVTDVFGPGTTDVILLIPGQDVKNVDAGLIGLATIGDYIWDDLNEDGIQNDGDTGINGMTVKLEDPSGGLIQTTTSQTDATTGFSGFYTFDNVLPGDYIIRFEYSDDYIPSLADQVSEDMDSDITENNGFGSTDIFNIISQQMNKDVDGGLKFNKGAVSGLAWEDGHFDGIRDPNEPNIPNVKVQLFSQSGDFIAEQITDAEGMYIFENILVGSYYLVFETLDAYDFTIPDAGTDDSLDSDVTGEIIAGATALFNILPRTELMHMDAGYHLKQANVSGIAWLDEGLDGIRDPGDPPVYGVRVKLVTEAGLIFAETTSHTSGTYNFSNIIPGKYYLVFEILPGLEFTTPDVGSDDALDSDVTGSLEIGSTEIFELFPGDNLNTLDAGYIIDFGGINGMVWEDVKYDGIRADSEPRIENVLVSLYTFDGNLQAEMFSQPGGFFAFINIPSGDYYLVFEEQEGFQFTLANQGSDEFVDSDVTESIVPGSTDLFTLPQGGVTLTFDAGYVKNQSEISGFVWLDENLDGIQDAGESGVSNIPVQLYDEMGNLLSSTNTDDTGHYNFAAQLVGSYYVSFDIPSNRTFTQADAGSDDGLDSDVTGDNGAGTTALFTIVPGGAPIDQDAGLIVAESEISGFVWLDENLDGIQDAGESGVSNIPVHLYDEMDNLLSSTNTDDTGHYNFAPQLVGSYYVSFDIPSNRTFTQADAGSDDGLDSDVTGDNGAGTTALFTIVPGGAPIDQDAGLIVAESEISGFVWLDENLDGIQDAGESGVSNIPVHLYDEMDNLLSSTNTDDTGHYNFAPQLVGSYYVSFDIPSNRTFTQADAGSDDGLDSDVTGDNGGGTTALFTIVPGGAPIDQDAGLIVAESEISGFVWLDENLDGIQDAGESGVSNISVHLYDEMDNLLSSTNTDDTGFYNFAAQLVGSYYVSFDIPSNRSFTQADAGSDDGLDSDVTGDNGAGTTALFTIVPGGAPIDQDAGLIVAESEISGFVWLDENLDGIQDAGESGVSNIPVQLYDEMDNLLSSTNTDDTGHYNFAPQLVGSYYVSFDIPSNRSFTQADAGSDDGLDSDVTGDNGAGTTALFTIVPGGVPIDQDAGLIVAESEISGFVWLDENLDGIQDAGESGVSNIPVHLYDEMDNLLSSTNTDDIGFYNFAAQLVGSYYVSFDIPSNRTFTQADAGSDDDLDSDVTGDNGAGTTALFTIVPGGAPIDQDAGLIVAESEISGFVWLDENLDGIQDAGESGVSNIPVHLYDEMDNLLSSTNTDDTGFYNFAAQLVGSYYVSFDIASNRSFTQADAGSDDDLDSDVTGDNGAGTTALFTIVPGGAPIDQDAGLIVAESEISGFVWLDENLDGIQDAGESGVSNIPVHLYDEMDNLLSSTNTDDTGFYNFAAQLVGSYYVSFDIPSNRTFTQADAGSDDDLDSDVTGDNGAGTTALFTIVPGGVPIDQDAGLIVAESEISGFVWLDENLDGIQDAGESGVSNIPVHLYNDSDNLIASTATNAQGLYTFSMQQVGQYYLVVEPGESFGFSPPDVGDDALDSDISSAVIVGSTDVFSVELGGDPIDLDAGLTLIQSDISGFVWLDGNLDGLQDIGELGISNVTVSLFDSGANLIETAQTDEFGQYLFAAVDLGDYYLIFSPIEGRDFTLPNVGADDNLDSDVDESLAMGSTAFFSVLAGGQLIDLDAGYIITESNIMGVVWEDLNRDGIEDLEEPGISGIAVDLYSASGELLNSTQSNGSGLYFFNAVPLGSYYLVFTLANGTEFTIPNAGADDNIDSDVTGQNGIGSTDVFNIDPGGFILGIDAGIISYNTQISGLVWEDKNGDGLRDITEELLAGIELELYDEMMTLVQSTMTGMEGEYTFTDIRPDNYYILVILPDNRYFTIANVGADDTIDSDISSAITEGSTDLFSLDFGQALENTDAGIFQHASISGMVWEDVNENGTQEGNELGINDIIIRLLDEQGGLIDQIASMTNANISKDGYYEFLDLDPGVYTVQFELQADFIFSEANVGSDDTLDSDVLEISGSLGSTDPIMLMSGMFQESIDAGMYQMQPEVSQIGDFVWLDNNGNGLQDGNEVGVPDVIVILFKSDGTQISSTTTDSHGFYLFTDILPDNYYLEFSIPQSYHFTSPDQGAGESIDSDVTESQGAGTTDIFQLMAAESNLNMDAGIYQLTKIGDFVWDDGNANGIQDNFEEGLDNIAIRLFDEAGNSLGLKITQADPVNNRSGYYSFTNIPPGTYYISSSLQAGLFFTDPDIGSDDSLDSDINSDNGFGTTSLFQVFSGDSLCTIDVGMLVEPANLGDFVWVDINGNGVQDDDEPGLNEVVVNLYSEFGSLISGTATVTHPDTGEEGYYNFPAVGPGSYYLEFIPPADYLFTLADTGGNDTKDSDVTDINGPGTTSIFNLDSGEIEQDVDAGVFLPGAIGDYVWFDENGNGLQDSFEDGVSDIEVTLFGGNNLPIETMTTDADGSYCFGELRQGLYFVKFNLPDDLAFTLVDVGVDDSVDSDVFPSGVTPLISLAHNVEFKDLDAGVIDAGSLIGNRVWLDLNANGIQDTYEVGIMGVEVVLYDGADAEVGDAFTDVSGEYIFDQLNDGDYFVHFVAPSGFLFSEKHAIADEKLDSDADPDGNTDMMTISTTQFRKDVDAGIYQPGNITSFVWEDLNANGLHDLDEPGLDATLVQLYNIDDKLIAEQWTNLSDDGNAAYIHFSGLKPDEYYLAYEPGELFIHTDPNVPDSLQRMNSQAEMIYGRYRTSSFILWSGEHMQEVNAGFYEEGSVGNKVWYDQDQDGIQDVAEAGLKDIGVVLYNDSGIPVTRALTDETGQYYFNDVRQGFYFLKFLLHEHQYFSPAHSGTNEEIDSDVTHIHGEATTDLFYVSSGAKLFAMDAGVILPGENLLFGSQQKKTHVNVPTSEPDSIVTSVDTRTIVFPNPAIGQLRFELDLKKATSLSYQIMDEKGQILHSTEIEEMEEGKHVRSEDIGGFLPGLYYLRIYQKRRIDVIPFVVVAN